jgi:sulfur carrier protein
MSLGIVVNGSESIFEDLEAPVALAAIIEELHLKGDRIAVERNGAIVERARWAETEIDPGDRLEIVHFVGGG